jgi:hypothetical protein
MIDGLISSIRKVIEYQIGQDYDVDQPLLAKVLATILSLHDKSGLESGRVLGYIEADIVDERGIRITQRLGL